MGIFRSLFSRGESTPPPTAAESPALEPLEPRLLLALPVGPPGLLTVFNETLTTNLMEALLASSPGMQITNVRLSGQANAFGVSSGVFVNNGDVYGMEQYGIVLSSGNAEDYGSGANQNTGNTTSFGVSASAAQETLLDQITGGGFDHYDVTQLDITFNLLPGFGEISFKVVFGSEEYPEYVGSPFVDGFGLFINGVNIASVGTSPVNINHPNMVPVAGTELDGVLAPGADPVLLFQATLQPESVGNILTFIIADTSDSVLDSTVYFSGLTANQAPEADDLDISTTQDTPVDGQVTGRDFQNDPITFSVSQNPGNGSVVMQADGSFTYSPDLGFYGVDTFEFIANDGAYDSLPGTVTVTINDPPTANDLVWNTDEDVAADGQTVGSDVQPQDLTYSLVSSPDHALLVFNDDGSFTYTPDQDFNGTDEFTFQVSDGFEQSNIATVSVTVNPVNDAPTADAQAVITVEDGVVVITLTGSDLETDSGDLAFTVTQDPQHGGYIQAGSQITYTADPGYSGLDSFQFTVTDTGDPAGGDQGWGFDAAVASAPATVDIAIPVKETFAADGTLALQTDEGTNILFVIEGQGTGWLYHFGGIVFDTPLDVSRLVLAGTNTQTVLAIQPDGPFVLGDLVVSAGSLQAVQAPSTDLMGNVEIANGSLAELHMQNASDGILTIGLLAPGGTLTVNLQEVADFGVDSVTPIDRLTVVGWVNTDAQADEMIVPWVRSLRTTGRRANARRGIEANDGDFDADLIASGTGLGADGLVLDKADIAGAIGGHWQLDGPAKTISARGGMQGGIIELNHDPASAVPALNRGAFGIMNGSSIMSTGNLRNMRIDGMVDSNLFAGVINWVDGDGLPDPATQINTASPAGIRKVNIRGARVDGWYVDNFDNSNIAAYNLRVVAIRNAALTNTGTEYGIAAWQATKITYADRNRANNWSWPNRRGNVLASSCDLTVDLAIAGVDSFLPGERVARDRTQDAGFAYTDISEVSLRALGGWVHVAIRTTQPLQDPLDDLLIRIGLDTNADHLSVLTNDDALSDYYVYWTMSGDTVEVWTGGGYDNPYNWSEIDAPTAYTTLTPEGVVISVPLSAFEDSARPAPGYEYVRLVEATILRDMEVVDAAG